MLTKLAWHQPNLHRVTEVSWVSIIGTKHLGEYPYILLPRPFPPPLCSIMSSKLHSPWDSLPLDLENEISAVRASINSVPSSRSLTTICLISLHVHVLWDAGISSSLKLKHLQEIVIRRQAVRRRIISWD